MWNGAINDIYHLVKDHLGQYRRQPGEKFDGYDAYLKDDKGSKSYLSFKFGFGWRVRIKALVNLLFSYGYFPHLLFKVFY